MNISLTKRERELLIKLLENEYRDDEIIGSPREIQYLLLKLERNI